MSDDATPHLLYGLPMSEVLYFDPVTVIEGESWLNYDWPTNPSGATGHLGGVIVPPGHSFRIEEWSTCEPRKHFPDADTVIERTLDAYCENDVTEDACETAYQHREDEDVVAAFEAAIALLASKIAYRMADTEIRTLTVTFADDAEQSPLIDGVPMREWKP